MFVIEVVSSTCFVPIGQKMGNVTVNTALAGEKFAVPHYFPPTFTASFSGTTDEFSASTLTRLYHLASPSVAALSIQINRNGDTDVGHCDITLSGYLVDMP